MEGIVNSPLRLPVGGRFLLLIVEFLQKSVHSSTHGLRRPTRPYFFRHNLPLVCVAAPTACIDPVAQRSEVVRQQVRAFGILADLVTVEDITTQQTHTRPTPSLGRFVASPCGAICTSDMHIHISPATSPSFHGVVCLYWQCTPPETAQQHVVICSNISTQSETYNPQSAGVLQVDLGEVLFDDCMYAYFYIS